MHPVIKNYLLVTKPGIVCGNLVTASAGFFLASRGKIDVDLLLSTAIGIFLVVASGCVFNNFIDRNLDQRMTRTRNRILVKGLISPKASVVYASLLGIGGMGLLLHSTNMLCATIVIAGFAIYVGVYSLYLKRISLYGVLIGSLAGAAPPLAGYCAVSGCLDAGSFILLAVFSLWQVPHCYAIAIYRFDDYIAAAIPVLPVKRGIVAAKRHIVGFILAFTASAVMLTFVGYTGWSTLVVTVVLGLAWLSMAWSCCNTTDYRLWGKRLFLFSTLTIFVLSVMISIDFTAPPTVGSQRIGISLPEHRMTEESFCRIGYGSSLLEGCNRHLSFPHAPGRSPKLGFMHGVGARRRSDTWNICVESRPL